MDLTKWSLEFVKWTQGEQNGVRRLENGAQSREGCEGQEPGVRRPAPIQVRFNSVRCSNILIDIRDPTVACGEERQRGHSRGKLLKRSMADLIKTIRNSELIPQIVWFV